MENQFQELISLAHKNTFSLYYKPGDCLVRTYFSGGSQHKETGETLEEAVAKMVEFLKTNKNI
ncbi:MAG: hypothetical protein P4L74_02525 [Candidatus Doudnabacteria bacterium]|nr:hypothetical protein [Candidatus Doudnabacteria bacterium]